ncbi:MAG TPA: GNAT family N-acetyltransferase [Methylomirabilota bacterium]|nr:GNAT family N-acetyltransferase [Methylomirabilota bacterium]
MAPRMPAAARWPFAAERLLLAEPRVRPATDADLPFCWDMLHEVAIAAPLLRGLPMADVLARPGVASHLTGWGRAGDIGLVAVGPDGAPLGAAWHRVLTPSERGLGAPALAGVPELTMAVRRACRGVGVGSALLAGLAVRARQAGYERLAALVDPLNGAVKFFRRHGFVEAGRHVGVDGVRLLLIGEIG